MIACSPNSYILRKYKQETSQALRGSPRSFDSGFFDGKNARISKKIDFNQLNSPASRAPPRKAQPRGEVMSTAAVNCDIKNVELADLGKKRIEWANQSMKVLQIIRKEFIKNQPLQGIRISACLHELFADDLKDLHRLVGPLDAL